MFKRKYTVTILNSKWIPIKTKVKFTLIPRKEEYVYLDGQYYEVLTVIHMVTDKQAIFVVINEISSNLEK